jgi:uncharacterized protein (TIGR02391 family)
MSSFADIFPPIGTALELEPEELGVFVLKHLGTLPKINRFNYTTERAESLRAYAGEEHALTFAHRLMEAWIWLEHEGLIAPSPVANGDWTFITRRGKAVLASGNFVAFQRASLLPPKDLDPVLSQKVRSLFLRGDYDTAILLAFKEVEVRVRAKTGLSEAFVGVQLMREAFQPKGGPLTDMGAVGGERQGMMDLFAGAMGAFKNPPSHRDMNLADPIEVADLIQFANHLLRIVERRSTLQIPGTSTP